MPAETPPTFFSATQRRLIGGTLLLLSVGAAVAAVMLAFIVLSRFVGYFSGVLWPLAVAGVLALILRPIVGLFEKRLRLRRIYQVDRSETNSSRDLVAAWVPYFSSD